jgi:hypothetical protein
MLGKLQGGVRLLLEQLFQSLSYGNHGKPPISERFGKARPNGKTLLLITKIL